MKSTYQYLAPNIIAGTHFNVERFNELYRWIEACRADALCINANGFGLLSDEKGAAGLDIKLSGDLLQLSKCIALTKQGSLINIRQDLTGSLHLKVTPAHFINDDRADVYLICVPGSRKEVGRANSSEVPLRAPFSVQEVRLEIHPPNSIPEDADVLKIAELLNTDGDISLQNYLPACLQNAAHPFLEKRQHDNVKQLKEFYKALALIIQNIDPLKEELIVAQFSRVCEKIGRSIALYIPEIKNTDGKSNPRRLFGIYSNIAELVKFEWYIRKSYHSDLSKLIMYNIEKSVVSFDLNTAEHISSHRRNDDNMGEMLHLIQEFNEHFILPILNMSKQSRILVQNKRTGWGGEEKEKIEVPTPKKKLLW